jgi:hypothetical protein
MVATREIAAGDALVQIPARLVITPATAHAALPRAMAERLNGDDARVLCAFLILERRKGDASWWAPYIKSLPSADELASCVTLSDEDATALCSRCDGGELLRMARKYRGEARSGYEAAHREDPSITEAEYYWAYQIVLTRACFAGHDSPVGVLVPWADMLNHSPDVETDAAFDRSSYRIVTKTPFRAGD